MEISPADRIRECNEINEEYARLLEYAGRAINALSPNAQSEGDAEMRRNTFEHNAREFFIHLQSATAKCKRQAYALEEAGIIVHKVPKSYAEPVGMAAGMESHGAFHTAKRKTQAITNGGMGKLDVGWLNSRGNKVGAKKEAELMDEANSVIKDLTAEKNDASEQQ
ncbi:hypothetical protein K470DRAFT_259715 [Piedraia hortae CBS 480.64]|uniref:Mediator of RNA polymerase II transcription subunit 11 n=1 Tax=Piedraia hortae CBS 480.64 TaxID=1314780 RepID=A0A6A7BU85_9PEZI|nr:hypothetical protein K470DRAFT_259715 [Piedraia hortae CBS 480.64]